MNNFEIVERKMREIEEKDRIRNFHPPACGAVTTELFSLSRLREVAVLKTIIKDAILDGKIPNERNAALQLLYQEAEKLGLKRQ